MHCPITQKVVGSAAIAACWLMLAACLTSPAVAGAWPREKGTGFVSAATNVAGDAWQGPYSIYSTTYLEYGIGHDLTLGLDIGHGVSGNAKKILFLRRPLAELSPGHLVAGELGFGRIAGENVLRPGLSYGHGLTLKNGKTGWISVETVSEHRLASGRIDIKADVTFGLNQGQRFKSILQLQTGISHGDPAFARLAPSLVMRVGDAGHLELGLTAGIIGDDHLGLKLGFWRDF